MRLIISLTERTKIGKREDELRDLDNKRVNDLFNVEGDKIKGRE